MAKTLRMACLIGTRPEVIKMASLIEKLRAHPQIQLTVISTAQHRQLLDDMLRVFKIDVDMDLNMMRPGQSLAELSGRLFLVLDPLLTPKNYDVALVHGDTTSSAVAAQVCFYHQLPVGHVEAGLRSYDFYHPFPEEWNRIWIAKLARWHFAPTEQEKQNLLAERNVSSAIVVTGNTVIDALYQIANRDMPLPIQVAADQKLLLVTCHRRESFGQPLTHICQGLLRIVHDNPQVLIVYPVHPNPHVTQKVHSLLDDCPGIQLLPPQPYDQFVNLMKHAYLVLTDSGGVQEEAPALAKPVLVLRDKTERPEIIRQGLGKVVGTDSRHIAEVTTQLLQHPECYRAMAQGFSPYGDGQASQRIVAALLDFLL